MKRIICFDLWETLIHYIGINCITYEDVLAEHWPRETVQQVVRDLLMTNKWERHPLAEHDGCGLLRPTYRVMAHMLLSRLPVEGLVFSHEGDNKYYDLDDLDLNLVNAERLACDIEPLWERENNEVAWILGAEHVLNMLRTNENTLILVTNATSCGWGDVNLRLQITRKRGRFDSEFVSCNHPFAKPDHRVWKWVEQQHPGANEYWMIGNDPKSDIEIPATMGWKTILVGVKGVPLTEVPGIIDESGRCDELTRGWSLMPPH